MLKLSGVTPAPVTSINARGRIDFAAFERHLASLRASGVSGWVPCGSSGEYKLMSDGERDSVLCFVKEIAKPGETLIAGTNAPSTAGVIAHTLRAKVRGYRATLMAVPFYTRPTQAEIICHFNAVINATDMVIVLCSYPGKDGVEIGSDALEPDGTDGGRALRRRDRSDDRRGVLNIPGATMADRPHHQNAVDDGLWRWLFPSRALVRRDRSACRSRHARGLAKPG